MNVSTPLGLVPIQLMSMEPSQEDLKIIPFKMAHLMHIWQNNHLKYLYNYNLINAYCMVMHIYFFIVIFYLAFDWHTLIITPGA